MRVEDFGFRVSGSGSQVFSNPCRVSSLKGLGFEVQAPAASRGREGGREGERKGGRKGGRERREEQRVEAPAA